MAAMGKPKDQKKNARFGQVSWANTTNPVGGSICRILGEACVDIQEGHYRQLLLTKLSNKVA